MSSNKTFLKSLCAATAMAAVMSTGLSAHAAPRQMERLDRGVVAVPALGGGVLVSWRLLGNDAAGISFNVYRDGQKLNAAPITDSTNFVDKAATTGSYTVRAVIGGREQAASAAVTAWSKAYMSIPMQKPEDGLTPTGERFSYTANDASAGDLDGDGRYDIVVKWEPTNAKDNSGAGYTGPVMLDAYTLEGKRLWRINLGKNIRAGAHYTQFMVADFDGDGKAEMFVKTADGAVDGLGKVIGDANVDWRGKPEDGDVPQADRTGAKVLPDGTRVAPLVGRILKGPEYLTVFDGMTGKALATKPYSPGRGMTSDNPSIEEMTQVWGDGYANRSERYLAGVAYLDGVHPSAVMARGYYGRSTLAAWDWRGGKLTQRWLFDSSAPGVPEGFGGQGNHQLSVADVDADGKDEIVYGSMVVDDNGKGLWTSKLYHGDAMHVTDHDPSRPGLEKFGPHESPGKNGGIVAAMLDARTGERLWTQPGDADNGRGIAIDIDPRTLGSEAWTSGKPGLFSAQGKQVSETKPRTANFAIWWDGDLLRELLDRNQISKWDWNTSTATPLLTAEGAMSNNGTKATPNLSADLLGDWREELLLRSDDSSELRLYATPYVTTHKITTLMHDPQYRMAIAWQNVAYNQPPHTGFYLGEGMKTPAKPNITIK